MKRRDFIKSSLAIGAGTVAGSCGHNSRRKLAEVERIYDFVIVGTGAGGAPLAARLASYGYSVLCIEAGKNFDDEVIKTPVLHSNTTEDPRWSWDFYVRHNEGPNGKDLEDSKFDHERGGILYPRASMVGGCTNHNAMITMYPDNLDWTKIEQASGDQSWGRYNMRQYFKKIERNLYRKQISNSSLTNGFKGWLATNQTKLKFLFEKFGGDWKFRKITEASARVWGKQLTKGLANKNLLSLDTNTFFKGPKTEGLYRPVSSIEKGRRSGPQALLLAAKEKYNLDILTNALASKVIFKEKDGDKRKAIAVECLINHKTPLYKASPLYNQEKLSYTTKKVFKAKHEIILCGGAFNTPQLLMLSGIGHSKELAKNNIRPIIHNQHVGLNLQDRYEIGVVTKLNEQYKILENCALSPQNDPCFDDYIKDPENHFYGTNGALTGHMVRSRHSKKTEDPDLFIFATPSQFNGYYKNWSKNIVGTRDQLSWAVLKAKTSNTNGFIKLKTNDPKDTPIINFKSFSDGKRDLEALVDGINFARKINQQSPLKSLTKEEVLPGKNLNHSDLEDFILKEAWGHHASCTCPMGHSISKGAVIDYDFTVHGTDNLRIVDASAFNRIPGHFIVVPIYMIAEKAADVIHKKYKSR